MTHDNTQLGFDTLLNAAETDNRVRKFERETGHLPSTMEHALPFYRTLIGRHHAAMLAADVDETMRLRGEAHLLAVRLNNGDPGILADDAAPGYVLARETAATAGTVPLWGQCADFVITVDAMRVRVELDGIFGIGCRWGYWPGFAAHGVDFDRPFLSETGYRSFLGIYADPQADVTPDAFIAAVIRSHVAHDLKGRLLVIDARYREQGAS